MVEKLPFLRVARSVDYYSRIIKKMLGNKLSRFIKSRYLVQPSAEDVAIEEDAKDEGELSEVVEEIPVSEVIEEEEFVADEVVEVDKAFLAFEKSNHGRSFGWWVLIDGKRVASLEYRCLLEDAVYLYSVSVLDDKFLEIDLDAEKWNAPNVAFQSRYAGSYIKKGLNMAAVGQKMIVVDDLVVPEGHFREQHKELVEFHDRLLDKAKSKSKSAT